MVTNPVDMASKTAGANLTGLARFLVRNKLITDQVATDAVAKAPTEELPFVAYVVKHKLASGPEIARIAASEFNFPLLV